MKLITFVTNSHTGLYHNVFYPSLKAVEPDQTVMVHFLKNEGKYGSDEFRDAMIERLEFIMMHLDGIEPFIVSDVDIRFFKQFIGDMKERMKHTNAIFQDNGDGSACLGFFALRPCHENKIAFSKLIGLTKKCTEDQHAFNKYKPLLNFKLLPRNLYWTHGYKTTVPPKRPEGIIMQHANWCVGTETKMKLLTHEV